MNRGELIIVVLIFVLLSNFVSATTFLPQTLNDLDKNADYVVIGNVASQQSYWEDKKIITTETTIQIEEMLKGESTAQTVVVKEIGGTADGIAMVVPGSPRFEIGERVALFLKEDARQKPVQTPEKQKAARIMSKTSATTKIYGRTVSMAQGKFRITKDKDIEVLVNDLYGANLLVEHKEETITLKDFRARYDKGFLNKLISFLKRVFSW